MVIAIVSIGPVSIAIYSCSLFSPPCLVCMYLADADADADADDDDDADAGAGAGAGASFFLSSLTSLEHLIQHLTREAHEKGVFRLVHAPQSISSNRTFPSLFSLSSTACRTSSMGDVCTAGQWRCSGFSGPR